MKLSTSSPGTAVAPPSVPGPRPAPKVARRPQRRGRPTWGDLPVVVRRVVLVVGLLAGWQAYVSLSGVSPLVFSAPIDVAKAFVEGWLDGSIGGATATTLKVLLASMALGIAAATVLTTLAAWTKFGDDVLVTLTSMLNPLPSIAILPLAVLWFGLSTQALIFVVANAVTWPIAINVNTGFKTANRTIISVARNIGIGRWRMISEVLMPAALPHTISGLKTGWAFGWRTLVAAELVFGVAGGSGGLGYYINDSRYFLQIPNVFAGLITIAVIGMLVELLFNLVERQTVVRWGMKGSS